MFLVFAKRSCTLLMNRFKFDFKVILLLTYRYDDVVSFVLVKMFT